ncbi:MAG: peptidoglycan-binding protein, partial [bacterium]|nr:peptidoglycan-binding protein [bacterium]
MIKKLAFSGLGILFLASTLVASPAMATTDPIAELRIRIAELQEQLARLISQSNTGSSSTSAGSSCLTLVSPLIIGSTDAGTNGEVSKLQRFLMSESGYTGPISGYYGQLTAQAVMRWQKAHGMDFVTLKSGVGPMTRAKIIESCHSGSTGNDTLDPVIYSVTPSSGPIGTKITIKGKNLSGFEGDLKARIATEFNPADYSSGVMYGER